jgi:hypothetical protein
VREGTLALAPALSPRERENHAAAFVVFDTLELSQPLYLRTETQPYQQTFERISLSSGERVGVRASVLLTKFFSEGF